MLGGCLPVGIRLCWEGVFLYGSSCMGRVSSCNGRVVLGGCYVGVNLCEEGVMQGSRCMRRVLCRGQSM